MALGALITVLAALVVAPAAATLALFTDDSQAVADVRTGRIFPGTRTTSAFVVGDTSGGGPAVDRSSPFAVAGDGLRAGTSAWGPDSDSSRYVEADLNAPLPEGDDVVSAALELAFASANPGSTACVYVQVSRASDDAVIATYGSAVAPVACATGTAPSSATIALPAVLTTDDANDLRVRLLGRDSMGSGWVVDQLTVSGSTSYLAFTLYPIRVTDAADGTPDSAPWELQGP